MVVDEEGRGEDEQRREQAAEPSFEERGGAVAKAQRLPGVGLVSESWRGNLRRGGVCTDDHTPRRVNMRDTCF